MNISSVTSLFRLGVRQKVLLILMTVLLLALSVSSWFTLQQEKQSTLEQINQRGSDISRFVAKALSFSVVGYDYHTIQLLIDEVTLSEDVGYAKVISAKGNTMAESRSTPVNGESALVVFNEDILLENKKVGSLVLGLSTQKTIESLEEHKYTQLKREAIIILLIAIGEFLALSYIIIRPVSHITRSLSDNVDDKGVITKQLPVLSKDEFGHMAEAFNRLGEQLNRTNAKLHSKIQLADKELVKTNKRLKKQSRDLESLNQEFKKISVTDSLTGAFNRRYFEELIKSDIEMTHRYGDANSMLLIDVDHFKAVNDNYGHPCGDKVLINIAEILNSSLRVSDTLCRIGGEEFAVLCKRSNKKDSLIIAEKLRSAVESTMVNCAAKQVKCTISIGITTIVGKGTKYDQHDIYRQSDIAVYHSKQTGRNQAIHYDDLDESDKSV